MRHLTFLLAASLLHSTLPTLLGADAVDGEKVNQVKVNGMVRYYSVYRPANLGARPAPAVICLQALDNETHLMAKADQCGFVVVYPHIPAYPRKHDGRDPQWRRWKR